MTHRIAKGKEGTVGNDGGKTRTLLRGEQSTRSAHRNAPQHLRPVAGLLAHPLRSGADIAAFEDTDRCVGFSAFAMVTQVEQKHAISTMIRLGGPLQKFKSRTIEP